MGIYSWRNNSFFVITNVTINCFWEWVQDNSGSIEKYIDNIESFISLEVCMNLADGKILTITWY